MKNHAPPLSASLLLAASILFSAFSVSASTTGPLLPTSDGNYTQWTPSVGTSHFANVDDTSCNGTTDYNSTTGVGNRDSYGVSLSSVPNGATITQIDIKPCAGRSASGGNPDPVMNVFYRTGGSNGADAGSYSLTSTAIADLATTSFSSLSITKGAGTVLEIGAVLTSAPSNKGARLSRIATTLTYTPLVAPTSLSGTASTSNAIGLSWTDNSSNEDGFNVERSTDAVSWTPIASTSANVTSFYDTGLTASTTYYHRVRAFNTGGYSSYSNVATTTTGTVLGDVVAYWKLDGNSNDAVGSNNGSDTNITYSTANGKINEGAGFDGSSSGINIGNMVSGLVNISVEAWIKTTATGTLGTEPRIVSQRNSGASNGQWSLFVLDGKVNFYTEGGGHTNTPGFNFPSSTTLVNDGNWHHVGVVQTGNVYKFYVDGVQDNVVDASLGGGSVVSYDGNLAGSIGYDRRDGNRYFPGDIDEVGVWNTALSASDFAHLYNSGAGLQYPF